MSRNNSSGKYKIKPCINCGVPTRYEKFCNNLCFRDAKDKQRFAEIIKNNALFGKNDKRHLIAIKGHRCEDCDRRTWNGQIIPLDLHHVDGNSDNHNLDNTKLLCPNCHRQTGNYAGANKNGKFSRRKKYRNQRYKNGESY